MSKWWSTFLAVVLVLAGLAAAGSVAFPGNLPNHFILIGTATDDDDNGPAVETVLDFDFFHQQKQPACSVTKQELDKSVAGFALADASNRPPEIFSRPFLIPTNTLLAQIGLPPRAPALA